MIYKEIKLKPIQAYLFIFVSSLLLFSPWQIGIKELFRNESYYAAMISDISNSSFFTIHSSITSISPLFAYIAYILTELGLEVELSIRLIGLLSIFCLSCLAYFATSRSIASRTGGFVAASVVLSSFLIIQKSLHNSIFFAGVLPISLGWFFLFHFGIRKHSWRRAWGFSLFFALLGVLFLGYSALFYFCLPLIFMRRPLTIWKRLHFIHFYIPFTLLIMIIFIWLYLTRNSIKISSFTFNNEHFILNYLSHLIKYPFEIMLRFMPWSLIGWAPFCITFQNMDKRPIISRYLRIIFISLFFYFWFNPYTNSTYYILLITPFAVMCGINYQVVIRKYGCIFLKTIKYIAIGIAFLALASLLYFLLPSEWLSSYELSKGHIFREAYRASSIVKLSLSCIICLFLILYKKHKFKTIWTNITLLSIAFVLIFWAVKIPYESQSVYKRTCAIQIKETIKEYPKLNDYKIIYKKDSLSLYGTSYYSGFQFISISDLEKLPKKRNVIYLTDEIPTTKRKWEKLGEILYKKHKLSIWLGKIEEKK